MSPPPSQRIVHHASWRNFIGAFTAALLIVGGGIALAVLCTSGTLDGTPPPPSPPAAVQDSAPPNTAGGVACPSACPLTQTYLQGVLGTSAFTDPADGADKGDLSALLDGCCRMTCPTVLTMFQHLGTSKFPNPVDPHQPMGLAGPPPGNASTSLQACELARAMFLHGLGAQRGDGLDLAADPDDGALAQQFFFSIGNCIQKQYKCSIF